MTKFVNAAEMRSQDTSNWARVCGAVGVSADGAIYRTGIQTRAATDAVKRVALFDYSQRKQADKKASELSTSQKSPHFVQPVKEVIEE